MLIGSSTGWARLKDLGTTVLKISERGVGL